MRMVVTPLYAERNFETSSTECLHNLRCKNKRLARSLVDVRDYLPRQLLVQGSALPELLSN